jgi:hypothetical protein
MSSYHYVYLIIYDTHHLNMNDPHHVWTDVHSVPNKTRYKNAPQVEEHGMNHMETLHQTNKLETHPD